MQRAHRQQDCTLRLAQGPTGAEAVAEAVAEDADVAAEVDTSRSVALLEGGRSVSAP